jgi:hypothetical protein
MAVINVGSGWEQFGAVVEANANHNLAQPNGE